MKESREVMIDNSYWDKTSTTKHIHKKRRFYNRNTFLKYVNYNNIYRLKVNPALKVIPLNPN